jgi:hypothetical protein
MAGGVPANSLSFSMGAVDGPMGLRLERHIFVADKGDDYDVADGLPQEEGWTPRP